MENRPFRRAVAAMCAHPTAANLLMVLFIVLGLMSIFDLKRETLPDFSVDAVEITALYPGARAEDVESTLVGRIEDALETVTHLDEVKSTAMENRAVVVAEMAESGNIIQFINDVKTEVEAINDFPDAVEEVVVRRINQVDPVVSIAVTGPMSPLHLKTYCEKLKDRLKWEAGITQVEIQGFSDPEFRVEIPLWQMLRFNLSTADIASAVASQGVDLPAGALETRERDVLIRFSEERKTLAALADLTVISAQTGSEIRLGDIARISDQFQDAENRIVFDGRRAGILAVSKTKAEDALEVMAAVEAFLEKERATAPTGMAFTLTQNVSKIVKDRLNMLLVNGVEGLILVFLAMLLFFPLRFSFWVAMGLPVSFLLSFFFMKHLGLSINMLSMVGLLIGIGLLMDDAIVIAENIAAQLEQGKKAFEAVVDGISQVAAGVGSSFLTTLFIFGTLALSMEGEMGKVLYAVPVVLILVLSVSLIEAFFILPNHLFHALDGREKNGQGRSLRQRIDQGLAWVRERILGRVVDVAIHHRYLFVGMVIFVFLGSLSLLAGGVLKFRPFPDLEGEVLQARLLFPQGTPLAVTQSHVERMTRAAREMNDQFAPDQPDGRDLVRHIAVFFNTNVDAGEQGAHVATISLDLLAAEERSGNMDMYMEAWRELSGDIPDAVAVAFKEPVIGPGGLPIEIRLQGENLPTLKAAAQKLMDWLHGYDGVQDLYDDLRPGKPEFTIRLKPGARARGFDARTVSRQLRAAFHGETAAEIMVRDEAYEINVMLADEDRSRMDQLSDFYITDPSGKRVPLTAIAWIVPDRGYAGIRRVNGVRTVTVTGDVDTRRANAMAVTADTTARFIPELEAQFPDVRVGLEGQNKETKKSLGGMIKALVVGIFGVFCLLSVQFRSFAEPLVIMVTIPFAFIGVILGHLIMGIDLCMPSIMGFVSLGGIVVNDSILLVFFVKQHGARGLDRAEAGKRASRDRFRAVMLTSITTVAGLLPLLSEQSIQAQILIPLATSIVFGLLVSTLLVLLVVPCLYAILGDFSRDRVGE
ncbi:MAG: efflux RND transporter permease subunit [Desulfobacterales bacterium]|nr:efflux RND transporter permease subunit [Desulfobacterales bacterium]